MSILNELDTSWKINNATGPLTIPYYSSFFCLRRAATKQNLLGTFRNMKLVYIGQENVGAFLKNLIRKGFTFFLNQI